MVDQGERMLINSPVARWLLAEGRFVSDLEGFLEELCWRWERAGVPVERGWFAMQTLHPELAAIAVVWEEGESQRVGGSSWGGVPDEPVRLVGADIPDDMTGFTEVILVPLRFNDNSRQLLGVGTRQAGGFSESQFEQLVEIEPVLSLILDGYRQRLLGRTLLDTYVGRGTGEEILRGKIKRGDRRIIEAVIFLADMRDFTSMTVHLSREELLQHLDSFFGVGVEAVERHGGEVLKFIGDALLAVFVLGERKNTGVSGMGLDEVTACRAAYRAAEELLKGLPSDIRAGVALHQGEVVYGNIGSPTRLDFTVIGAAVNAAARMVWQCKVLDREIVASAPVAARLDVPMEDLGEYWLRGIPTPERLFSPANSQDMLSDPHVLCTP
jgi:adenylate cyclase